MKRIFTFMAIALLSANVALAAEDGPKQGGHGGTGEGPRGPQSDTRGAGGNRGGEGNFEKADRLQVDGPQEGQGGNG
ncbi:MAG: hypothetical protein IT285_06735 [Bdellovibrionales bacterium]|nr:hypothetical protein [Bdellovibrionales bacterium]